MDTEVYGAKSFSDSWTNDKVTHGTKDRWDVNQQITSTGYKHVTGAE